MKWFTSDLHFAHPFVAALRGYALPGYARDESIKQQAEHDGRQLKDCVDWRKHDADIIQAINTYVGKEDELYILGDISSGSTWSVEQAIMRIQNLQVPRKRRHLILGNHEIHSSSRTLEKLASVFGEVGRVGLSEHQRSHRDTTLRYCALVPGVRPARKPAIMSVNVSICAPSPCRSKACRTDL